MKSGVPPFEWWVLGVAAIGFAVALSTQHRPQQGAVARSAIPAVCLGCAANVYGPKAAPWRIVDFMDYDCPPCRHLEDVAELVCDESAGRLQWQVVMFPLPMHPHSRDLAGIALTANQRGCLATVHLLLLKSWRTPLKERIRLAASAMGMSSGRLSSLMSTAVNREVGRQLFLGHCLGLQGAPSVFLVSPGGAVWEVSNPTTVPAFIRRASRD